MEISGQFNWLNNETESTGETMKQNKENDCLRYFFLNPKKIKKLF